MLKSIFAIIILILFTFFLGACSSNRIPSEDLSDNRVCQRVIESEIYNYFGCSPQYSYVPYSSREPKTYSVNFWRNPVVEVPYPMN